MPPELAGRFAWTPLLRILFHREAMYQKEQQDDNCGRQYAAFRAVSAPAPKITGFPMERITGDSHCKPTQVLSEQRQGEVPSEVEADGQPEGAGAQIRIAE